MRTTWPSSRVRCVASREGKGVTDGVLADEPLPPELEALRARIRAFVADVLLPAEREAHVGEEGQATPELRRLIRSCAEAAGLFRLAQPVELGGGGLGPLGQVALHEALAASGAVLAGLVVGGSGGLLRHGNDEQRARFLLPVLRGALAVSFAFTDAREGPRTTAAREDDCFRVSGVKSFVTDGPAADLLLTVARVVDAAGASQ